MAIIFSIFQKNICENVFSLHKICIFENKSLLLRHQFNGDIA